MKITKKILTFIFLILIVFTSAVNSQYLNNVLKLKPVNETDLNLSSENSSSLIMQKPTKKIYFVPGGKIGMFFLMGDYQGNQMLSLEVFGKYVGEGFWAEISLPFRFKTSPAFTDIGLDVNVMYPFLGKKNKSEDDTYVGGGLGLHFIGRDKGDSNVSVAARGGLGLNLIAGAVFFKNYDFNVV